MLRRSRAELEFVLCAIVVLGLCRRISKESKNFGALEDPRFLRATRRD